MVLERSTWQDVRDFDREAVCLIPTGSLEQHGPHLPLFTDTLLSTGVARLAEEHRPEKTVLYPGIWLGCSTHHMAMPGTATATVGTYVAVLSEVIEAGIHHGFRKFFVLNGHGGNTEPNGVALRELKAAYEDHVFSHCGYFQFITQAELDSVLKGPLKGIRHACEAEASMMLHLYPDRVRKDLLRDDGLEMEPPAPEALNYIQHFDEVTDEGSWGYATYADAETGRQLIETAVAGTVQAIDHIHAGYVMRGAVK
ncbi:MAG: creatininase family protein [Armatimonadetes bacterium]|nr:creatininase family protein [Armatimonadota bacterium]